MQYISDEIIKKIEICSKFRDVDFNFEMLQKNIRKIQKRNTLDIKQAFIIIYNKIYT